MKLNKKQEKKLKEKMEEKPIPNELDYAEELDKAPSIPVEEKNARAIETIEEKDERPKTPTPMKLKKKQEKKLKEKKEEKKRMPSIPVEEKNARAIETIEEKAERPKTPTPMKLKKKQEKKLKEKKEGKPIPNELDYVEELDKAPSILVKEKNARAIETIEEKAERPKTPSPMKLKKKQEKKLKEKKEGKPIPNELDYVEEHDKAPSILVKEKNARAIETIEEKAERPKTPTPMKLKKKQEKKLKEKKEEKPIPNELDYVEELDKAPSIPVEEKNARAIETIEEVKGIVSSSSELEEFYDASSELEEFYDEADGAQQHHQELGFSGDLYLLFELIGNYIGLRDRVRLRVVCRVWNEVVSQKEVYGMFVQTGDLISFFSLKKFLDPLDVIHDKHFEGGDMVLVSSCQGILCFRTTSEYIISNHHRKYIVLPPQTINHGKKKVVAILCHELGDGDFKLAIAFATKSLNLAFDVYAYAEGRWFTIVSSIKGQHVLYLRRDGLYHNGSAYFLSEWGCIYKFNLVTEASFLLRDNALRSDILGVFQNRVCTFRFDRVAAGCELVVASVKENVVQCSLKLDWARLNLSPSGCRILTCTKDHNIRILTCTKDHNIIIAIGMEIFWYKIHSEVLEPIGSLREHDKANFVAYSCYDFNEHDKANFVAYSCYDVNEILRF